MDVLQTIGTRAKEASYVAANLTTKKKNEVLQQAADLLLTNSQTILEANLKDVEAAKQNGLTGALVDRLTLTMGRLQSMANGLRYVAELPDPKNSYDSVNIMENGLTIAKKRVPLGVVGIIYEARPNVTADAFGLCFKAGNAVILRGGKEAICSNKAIISILRLALSSCQVDPEVLQFVEDTSRESALQMMRLNGLVDVLIPRGGAGLIASVVQNSTVPVIETGTGNCHIFIDESANLEKAVDIVVNAKISYPSACNACEKLLVHKAVAQRFLPPICQALQEKQVEIRGDKKTQEIVQSVVSAKQSDWDEEYLSLTIAVAVVDSLEDAILHIKNHSTGHSEVILTESLKNAEVFTERVDAAAVYVNASSRFTDGGEFGLGAEIGISTQKLHARGPMGLKELTTTKYVVFGDGQIRV